MVDTCSILEVWQSYIQKIYGLSTIPIMASSQSWPQHTVYGLSTIPFPYMLVKTFLCSPQKPLPTIRDHAAR